MTIWDMLLFLAHPDLFAVDVSRRVAWRDGEFWIEPIVDLEATGAHVR